MKKTAIAVFAVIMLLTASCLAISDTAAFLKGSVAPEFSDEWSVFALNRGDYTERNFNVKYYNSILKKLKNSGGILSERKYTEYARAALALTSIGVNAENICGYNLIEKLDNFDAVTRQGINGAIFALIAADSHGYTLKNREKYVTYILSKKLPDGGFAMSGDKAESDITAMAICALVNYRGNAEADEAVSSSIEKLLSMKNENGSFSANGAENAESTAQVICALSAIGEDVRADYPDIYNALMSFKNADGSFSHIRGGNPNIMATEQALCALISAEKRGSIYDMKNISFSPFCDIYGDENEDYIERLFEKGVVKGAGSGRFNPEGELTRAEFAAMAVRALGAEEREESSFSDVSESDWFFGAVGTAKSLGIINGVDEKNFAPNRHVTRAEAEVMTARAFKKSISERGVFSDETKKYYITRSEMAKLLAENIK